MPLASTVSTRARCLSVSTTANVSWSSSNSSSGRTQGICDQRTPVGTSTWRSRCHQKSCFESLKMTSPLPLAE